MKTKLLLFKAAKSAIGAINAPEISQKQFYGFQALERSLDFIGKIRVYVSCVVFYSVDFVNLLPVVRNTDNRRKLSEHQQKPY